MKAAVGASKEFIDAYIAQLYKSFKVVKESEDLVNTDSMTADLKKYSAVKDVELDGKNITFSVNGEDFLLKNKTSSWDLLVNGYKQSLEVSDGLITAKEVVAAAKTVNNKWFKEYDPQYYPR